ncbi:MAG: ribonuclease J [Clostridiales bacterium]|nr:ribonuclease J [Clostridiales bacterium]
MTNSIKIIPLGGIDEIGKNLTVFEYGDHIIIVDCGLAFPDIEMLGVDIVIPDTTYLVENKDKIKGIFITHGHEDHIGALPYVLREVHAPIYGSKLTIELIRYKLKEHNIDDRYLNVVEPRQVIKKGHFKVEFLRVNHSIQGAFGLAIRTPAGLIVHTGDFKVDYTPVDGEIIDLARFAQLGEEKPLLMLADSTNAEYPGSTISEKQIGENMMEMFKEADGRIIVATFSSNIHRVQQIIQCAEKYGRKVCFLGRSMIKYSNVASAINELTYHIDTVIESRDIKKHKKNKMVIITTGSQGESMSGLVRMATSKHAQIEIGEGDTVIISASPIPGNEKYVYKVINQLFKRGANVIYSALDDVHVSGHARQEELTLMHTIVKPKYFMPVHGEHRHLRMHEKLAVKLGMDKDNIIIPSTGSVYELSKKSFKRTGKVQSGAIMVDGLGVGDVGSVVLRDRKHMSQDGMIIVTVIISKDDGTLLSEPDVISRGFIYMKESEELIEEMKNTVLNAINANSFDGETDWATIRVKIRKVLRKHVYAATGRNPLILPVIMEI